MSQSPHQSCLWNISGSFNCNHHHFPWNLWRTHLSFIAIFEAGHLKFSTCQGKITIQKYQFEIYPSETLDQLKDCNFGSCEQWQQKTTSETKVLLCYQEEKSGNFFNKSVVQHRLQGALVNYLLVKALIQVKIHAMTNKACPFHVELVGLWKQNLVQVSQAGWATPFLLAFSCDSLCI